MSAVDEDKSDVYLISTLGPGRPVPLFCEACLVIGVFAKSDFMVILVLDWFLFA